jgi:hypothetical protein
MRTGKTQDQDGGMHLIWDVDIRQQTGNTAQYHWYNICVNVFVSIDVDPHDSWGEQEYAGVLIAGA